MSEPVYELEPLDRVVNLYLVFRGEGETPASAWRWAVSIARALEAESFRESVERDLEALNVVS